MSGPPEVPVASAGLTGPSPSWEALVGRMAGGDEGALAALYDATSGIVFALALRITGDRRDAEEVLLDTYAKAWRSAPAFETARGSARAWLVMMARSVAIDRKRGARLLAGPLCDAAEEAPSPALGPDEQFTAGETSAGARRALRKLPREQRQVLELAFFEGLTHTDLSTRLGLPLGTVKTRIRLGMQRLRALLEQEAVE